MADKIKHEKWVDLQKKDKKKNLGEKLILM